MATMESQSRNGADAAFPGDATGEAHSEAAEEVRAWLVQVRGGAPFLSAADARVLLDWLESGTPVVAILRAIEASAAHRRAKRLRVPFTLKGCARFIGKGGAAMTPVAPPVALPPVGRDEAGDDGLGALLAGALAEVRAVTGEDADAVSVARCAIARRFHEAAWTRLEPRRAELLAEAAVELDGLRDVMDAEDFERVCEEAARHRVRTWFPALSVELLCQPDGTSEEATRGLD